MFDRETRRAKILEARGRARRDNRGKSAHAEVNLSIRLHLNFEKKNLVESRENNNRRWNW